MPVIPALWGLKQEDYKFETNLGYIGTLCPPPQKKGNEMNS
jgi:hypothetical protein